MAGKLMAVMAALVAGPAWAATTSLALQSQPADTIGQGETLTYVAPTASFVVAANTAGITVSIAGGGGQDHYTVTLSPPAGGRLQNGVYEGAQRAASHAQGVAGMEVDASDRTCSAVSGRFELFNVITAPNGTLTSFNLEFEQHCGGGAAALFGQMLYNTIIPARTYVSIANAAMRKGEAYHSTANAIVSLSRPSTLSTLVSYATLDGTALAGVDYIAQHGGVVIPAGATSVPLALPILGNRTATHGRAFQVVLSASRNALLGAAVATMSIVDPNAPLTVVALNSQAGDFIGGGQNWLELPSVTSFRSILSSSHAGIDLGFPQSWALNFAAAPGQALAPGAYANAQIWPAQPNAAPGLSVSATGLSCASISGNFSIGQMVSNGAGGLAAFAADFQQNCQGETAALFGSVRINAILPQLSVTDGQVGNQTGFTVTVNPASTQVSYILFRTQDGTAMAGTDYVGFASLVLILPGETSTFVPITLLAARQPGRVFYANISSIGLPIVWIGQGRMKL